MRAGEVGLADPEKAWETLASDPKSMLIDCRTKAEWSYVGVPDLGPIGKETALIEWRRFPDLAFNTSFVEQALAAAEESGAETLFFICRSGARSMEAARATLGAAESEGRRLACVNIVEGFEGELDEERHRGTVNGWKARGLPWRQS